MTLLRIVAGVTIALFGVGKFVAYAAEKEAFERYGLPEPGLFVVAVGIVELGCGLLVALGVATRPAALLLAANMAGAVATGGRIDGGFLHLVLGPALLVAFLVIAVGASRRPPRSPASAG
jgi:putative oxidoreductase